MRKLFGFVTSLVLGLALLFPICSFAADWQLIGPEGGNVRSLTYDPSDPNRIILGTSAGQLFISQDGGSSWNLFAHLGQGEDYVIDHVIFDPTNPATVYAAAWGLFGDSEGGVFRSDDGGRSWSELMGAHGKSIRAMAMAPSDHNTLVIAAVQGVFRSRDAGATWERISPENPMAIENHSSLKNFVSVAIDPQNPDIIYAGTQHLPWKTTDGGAHWHNLKEGILDDSDVFSIIIDPRKPSRVYASACSGIYLSENGAELFHRVQGLPHSAIRTRVLKQDPQRPSIVYAGTTGGLWKTTNGGAKWTLVSAPDVIVNDVLIDPRNPERVLLATDLRGVLVSTDGFAHYTASNRGFTHRVVGAVIADRKDPGRLYVGVVNDKEHGGFFTSDDAGKSWRQSNRGLNERDILSMQQADGGTLFVGTNHGIFSLASLSASWLPAKMILGPVPEWQPKPPEPEPPVVAKPKTSKSAAARKAPVRKPKAPPEPVIPLATAPRVRSLQMGEKAWYAATDQGLFISVDHGEKWYGQPIEGDSNFSAVNRYEDGTVTLAGPKGAYISQDDGKTWTAVTLPSYVSGAYNLTVTPGAVWWLGTRQGALRSTDSGQSWHYMLGGLPKNDVLAVHYDAAGQRLLATALHEHGVFESKDGGQSWQRTPEAAVSLRSVMNFQGRLLAASPHNGLLLEQGTASAESARASDGSSSANRQ
ncbi:MAG: WD40/YVTN/BNR-like repeat-containing protein [Candidatus Korobacteraceae bacterium]